jgi:outer membrane protein TolC
MKSLRYLLSILVLLVQIKVTAQDTARKLSEQQFREIVRQYHPLVRQADIFVEKAKADVTIARGMFDPVIQNESSQKTFDGVNYYNYNRPSLNIPTWFGVEVSAGLEYLSGSRTDPVETKGESSYLGVSIPLAKNLLMDKRRAALQSAKIFQTASAAEKRNILNNLYLEAITSYWNWVKQYQVYRILHETVALNEKRLALVKTAYQLGERPAIDTTEALAQLQQFELLRNQSLLDFRNSGLELSLYLWTNNAMPYQLPEDIVPATELAAFNTDTLPLPALNNLLETARKHHPDLLLYSYKLDVLGIEKKLKFQELLPTVNFRYNQLARGYNVAKTIPGPLFENNFQYGLYLGIPLRLSQGRGEYKKAKLKIEETRLMQNQKLLQVEIKVKTYFNELVALQNQVNLQEKAWKNYLVLLRGEDIRFRAGESSLFLVNARENKMLEALQKLQELKTKFLITENKLKWAAGVLAQ